MNLKSAVINEERIVLKEIGHALNESNCDVKYKDTYFQNYEDNLWEEMDEMHKLEYADGAGGEIECDEERENAVASNKKQYVKMASIRSSSAMTFNLLGNKCVDFINNNYIGIDGEFSIHYEKKLPTINGRSKPKANLDAYLVSKNSATALFCEMKMLEWFENQSENIREAYKIKENYLSDDIAEVFLRAICIIERMKAMGAFKHYDVWQMLKHTIAINRYMNEEGKGKHTKVTLLNVVFEPDMSAFNSELKNQYLVLQEAEREGFLLFNAALKEAGVMDLMADYQFSVSYISAKDFISCIHISDEKRQYLRRYTLEAI